MYSLQKAFPNLKQNLAFVKDLLIKKFEIDPSLGIPGLDFKTDNYDANISKLRDILHWCDENLDETMHTVNSGIVLKLLEYTVIKRKFDFDLFNRYLNNPL